MASIKKMYFGFNNYFIIKNVSCRPPSPNDFLSCSNPFSSQFLTPFSSSSHFSLPIFANIFPSSSRPIFFQLSLLFLPLSILFLLTIYFLLLLAFSLPVPTFSLPSRTLLSQFPSLFLPVFLSQSSTLPYFTHFSPIPIVSPLISNSFSHFQ